MVGRTIQQLRRRWRRQVRPLPILSGPWRYSRPLQLCDPSQGWKIHLAATLLTANDLLARAAPILRRHNALFKVPARLELLEQLNAGFAGFSQIGKFLTVYPASDKMAVVLARELHAATRHLLGPAVPFDVRYRNTGVVYYRYGSFRDGNSDGRHREIIFDRAGKAHPDRREPGRASPPWIPNPFMERRVAAENGAQIGGLLGTGYLPFRAISQRGKGGVYEALDLTTSPARLMIIKEGRRDGEVDWDGRDGYARVKHEAAVLRALRKAGLPVPKVFREFDRGGNRYVVLKKLRGRPLLKDDKALPGGTSSRRAEKILVQLKPILAKLHGAGWVWRDCKPSHILLDRGEIRLVDFEGACRVGKTDVLPSGSPGYTRRPRFNYCRRPGISEDQYALGAIAFQIATGKLPPRHPAARLRLYRRHGCPAYLRAKIDNLLRSH
jgi:hypothetical protein